jgi:hypothetical protein
MILEREDERWRSGSGTLPWMFEPAFALGNGAEFSFTFTIC